MITFLKELLVERSLCSLLCPDWCSLDVTLLYLTFVTDGSSMEYIACAEGR